MVDVEDQDPRDMSLKACDALELVVENNASKKASTEMRSVQISRRQYGAVFNRYANI